LELLQRPANKLQPDSPRQAASHSPTTRSTGNTHQQHKTSRITDDHNRHLGGQEYPTSLHHTHMNQQPLPKPLRRASGCRCSRIFPDPDPPLSTCWQHVCGGCSLAATPGTNHNPPRHLSFLNPPALARGSLAKACQSPQRLENAFAQVAKRGSTPVCSLTHGGQG